MNGRQEAIAQIREFIESDNQGMLLTGTHQLQKHLLVMAVIGNYFTGKSGLFRIDSLSNTTHPAYVNLAEQPKAGEAGRLLNCHYTFDASTRVDTWRKTKVIPFNFAIVYPIDWMIREQKLEPLIELTRYRDIGKVFYISCKDSACCDYSLINGLYQQHVVLDCEEGEPEYHERVLAAYRERPGEFSYACN